MQNWRKTSEYRRWKKAVIKRDGKCRVCNQDHDLHAHHKNHATYFPEQRFNKDNGVALCEDCHTHYHCSYHASFRTKCTEKQFLNFLELLAFLKEKFAYDESLNPNI